MFGFSLTKLLFTVAVILIVWYGFKWLGRVQAQRNAGIKRKPAESGRQAPKSAGAAQVEDMVECATCGSFVPARGATNCGQAGCPYPG